MIYNNNNNNNNKLLLLLLRDFIESRSSFLGGDLDLVSSEMLHKLIVITKNEFY